MRSEFELQWLSEAQTKESSATHIPWSVCRDANEELEPHAPTDSPVALYP